MKSWTFVNGLIKNLFGKWIWDFDTIGHSKMSQYKNWSFFYPDITFLKRECDDDAGHIISILLSTDNNYRGDDYNWSSWPKNRIKEREREKKRQFSSIHQSLGKNGSFVFRDASRLISHFVLTEENVQCLKMVKIVSKGWKLQLGMEFFKRPFLTG